MIFYRWIFRSLYLPLLFTISVSAEWPSITSSTIQLLGLFADPLNTSQSTTISVHSRAMFKAAIILSHRYNITLSGQTIGWRSVQTGGDVMEAFRSTCLMVSTSHIVGIVGPAFSRESHVIAPFAQTLGIPVISFASTDPNLSDRATYPTFFRTIPSDDTAALAIVKLFLAYNWTSCVIIYQNDAFGTNGATAIDDAFQNNDLTVTDMIIFDTAMLTIRGDLKSLLISGSTRVVLVWAQASYAQLILQTALDNNLLGPQFMWILSSSASLSRFGPTSYNQLIGILTVQAVVGSVINAPINNTLLNAAYDVWQQYEPETFPGSDSVEYYGLFAFDATWSLIGALQEFCSTMTDIFSSCLSLVNTSFCFDRQLLNSTGLFDIIRTRTFLGVSGWVEFGSNVTDRINGTYYISKNVQTSSNGLKYLPATVWSDLKGWLPYTPTTVIVWPGNTLTRPTGYGAMSDLTLRIAVVEAEPYTSVTYITNQLGKTTTKLIGYVPDLIDLLQTNMGFIPNITLFPSNQSYNELVNKVANGDYDMIVADLTITAARREKVSFSNSIFDNSLRVIIQESPSVNVDFLAYLKPFSWKLWLVLLCTTIYAGLLICFLERHENRVLRNRSAFSVIALGMWYAIATVLGYGADFHVRTAPGRLLTVGLYILCLISVAAYTANLASDITISRSSYLISGIDDIQQGKVPYGRVGIIVGSSIEDYYLREVSHGVRNFFPLASIEEMFNSLLNNAIDASIMDAGLLEYATSNVYCNLSLVGSDFDRSSFGIATQKKWQYAQQLDVNLLSLAESGTLDSLRIKWFQSDSCGQSSDGSVIVSIESMAGLLLTFGLITVLAVLLFLWTQRFVLRDYLLIMIRSIQLLAKERNFPIKKPRKTPVDRTLDSKLTPSCMI